MTFSNEHPARDSYQIIEAIRRREPNATDVLLARHGRGLQFLIKRYVSESEVTVLMQRIVSATIAVVRAGEIESDAQIAKFMHAALHYAVRSVGEPEKRGSKLPSTLRGTITDLKLRLEIFTAAQVKALSRYYIDGERIVDICDSITISEDRFAFWREMMRSAVDLSFELTSTVGKPTIRENMEDPKHSPVCSASTKD